MEQKKENIKLIDTMLGYVKNAMKNNQEGRIHQLRQIYDFRFIETLYKKRKEKAEEFFKNSKKNKKVLNLLKDILREWKKDFSVKIV